MNDAPKTPQESAAIALANLREALRRLKGHKDAADTWSTVGRAIVFMEHSEAELNNLLNQ